MRAWLLYGPEDARLVDAPRPEPRPGEVVLRVAAALTCGTDLKIYRRGSYPKIAGLPAPFGHELAGKVAAVGPGVDRFRPGQRVVAANSAPCGQCFFCRRQRFSLCEDPVFFWGAFATYATIPARIVDINLYPVPDGLPLAHAALMEPLACTVRAVEVAEIQPGDQVAIVGGGALGLLLTRLAALAGAQVIVCDRHAERRQVARAFGAAHVVDPSAGEPVAAVRALANGGRGADRVIEAVGTLEAWRQALAMARKGGTVLFFGGCAPGTALEVDAGDLHYGELTLKGTFHYHPRHAAAALGLITSGRVDPAPLLSGAFPLDGVLEALRRMAAREGLKYVITP
jgi:L-iditol 2-dehydrogenase